MIDATVAIGMISAGVAAVGAAAVLVPPTRRLAPRVRPYTIATRARFGRTADVADLAPASQSSSVGRLFGPPVVALVQRVGRLLERRTDAALARSLRQAGFVDVTPDEYRTRMALQALAFGAAGCRVRRRGLPPSARGDRALGVRRPVRRVPACAVASSAPSPTVGSGSGSSSTR